MAGTPFGHIAFAERRAVGIAVFKELHILLLCQDALEIVEVRLTLGLTEFPTVLDVLGLLLELLIAKLLDFGLLVGSKVKLGKSIHHTRISLLEVV